MAEDDQRAEGGLSIKNLEDNELDQVGGGDSFFKTIGYYVGLAYSYEAYGWEQVR